MIRFAEFGVFCKRCNKQTFATSAEGMKKFLAHHRRFCWMKQKVKL